MSVKTSFSNINFHAISQNILNFKDEPFCFKKDALCSDQFLMLSSDAFTYKITSDPESTDSLTNFRVEYIKSASIPLKKFNQKDIVHQIYKNANILDMQTLSLDPLYAFELSATSEPIESKIIHACFLKQNNQQIVAVVTNLGQCEILKLNTISRNWDKSLICINYFLFEMFPLFSNLQIKHWNFSKYREYIENNSITSCCFLNNLQQNESNEILLICSNITGLIFGVAVKDSTIKLKFKIESHLYKLNHLQSFTYQLKNGINKTILVASNVHGQIKLFKYNDKYLTELCTIWNKKDKMSSKTYEINYCTKNELLFVATTKSSHFLLAVISSNDENIFTGSHCCDTHIVGFDSINPYEYIICTSNAITKNLKIILNEKKSIESISSCEIRNDFESENYIVIGMLATANKVGWIFLFNPRKEFIASRKNTVCFMTVYTLNIIDPLYLINNLNPEECLKPESYADCHEIIRLRIQKNILSKGYHKYLIEPIEISENFQYRLRIRLLIVYAIGGFNLRKVKSLGKDIELELNNIISTIIALNAFWRLKYLQSLTDLTKFQKQSAKFIMYAINEYLSNSFNDQYLLVQNELKPMIQKLLTECKHFSTETEICYYCNENMDLSSEKCAHHQFPKCCISFVQIPSLKMKSCKRCKLVALDDDNLLKEILMKNQKIKCSLCDYLIM